MSSSIREKIVGWLTSAGYIVAPLQTRLPPAAEWGVAAMTPPPVQVKLRVLGLKGDLVVLGLGVNFSDTHKQLISNLPLNKRVEFTSELVGKLLAICPYCRLAVQGGLQNPTAIAAEILYYADSIEKQRLIDDAARLVNIFMLINAELWRRFPEHHVREKPSEATSFM